MQNLNILCLNCQKGYCPDIKNFLPKILASDFYDFLLLQEANDSILPMIKSTAAYRLLTTVNPDNHQHSHLCIVYRAEFALEESDFLSFVSLERKFGPSGEPGLLLGRFSCRGRAWLMGSVHLHPSFAVGRRGRAIGMIKQKLLLPDFAKLPTIFGGDFNFGFPREGKRAVRRLKPEFVEATAKIGPTLNSRYTEKGTHLAGKLGGMLRSIGIKFTFRTDRIFIDKSTTASTKPSARVLPDRVSDHSPVEVILQGAKNPAQM